MALQFLDTNVLLRHLTADHAQYSPRATAYLETVERGEQQVRLADTVVFEAVFTLQRSYQVPKAEIRHALLPLLELPGVVLPGKRQWRRVFELYVDLNLSFGDAYHATMMERLGISEVVSFDREFDRIPTLTRVEP